MFIETVRSALPETCFIIGPQWESVACRPFDMPVVAHKLDWTGVFWLSTLLRSLRLIRLSFEIKCKTQILKLINAPSARVPYASGA
jgi:hypothetical protein